MKLQIKKSRLCTTNRYAAPKTLSTDNPCQAYTCEYGPDDKEYSYIFGLLLTLFSILESCTLEFCIHIKEFVSLNLIRKVSFHRAVEVEHGSFPVLHLNHRNTISCITPDRVLKE